jgi:hypothetical protein
MDAIEATQLPRATACVRVNLKQHYLESRPGPTGVAYGDGIRVFRWHPR